MRCNISVAVVDIMIQSKRWSQPLCQPIHFGGAKTVFYFMSPPTHDLIELVHIWKKNSQVLPAASGFAKIHINSSCSATDSLH